jgi:hypothetical protein
MQFDIPAAPSVALMDERGGSARHEENGTGSTLGIERAPEQRSRDFSVAGHAGPQHRT